MEGNINEIFNWSENTYKSQSVDIVGESKRSISRDKDTFWRDDRIQEII